MHNTEMAESLKWFYSFSVQDGVGAHRRHRDRDDGEGRQVSRCALCTMSKLHYVMLAVLHAVRKNFYYFRTRLLSTAGPLRDCTLVWCRCCLGDRVRLHRRMTQTISCRRMCFIEVITDKDDCR